MRRVVLTATETVKTERYAHLDGLRGLAAFNVLVHHAIVGFDFAAYTGASQESHFSWEVGLSAWPLLMPVAGANFSVCVFFVLSGFVLAHAFAGSPLGMPALATKRAIRLGAPILVATLLSWAALSGGLMFNHAAAPLTRSSWMAGQMQQTASLWDALREGSYASLIRVSRFATTYDSSLWTMSIEFAGSLVLIALFAILRRLRRHGHSRQTSGVALLVAGVALQPLFVSLIVLGAAIAMLEPRRLIGRRTLPGWLIALLVVIALVLGTVPYSAARGPWWDQLIAHAPRANIAGVLAHVGGGFMPMDRISLWHGIGAILLVLTIEWSPTLRRLLSRRLPQRLGLISFPLYLIHIPVLLSVGCGAFLLADRAGLGYAASVAVATLVFAAVAIGLAAAAVGLVERPAVRLAARAGAVVQSHVERAKLMARYAIRRGYRRLAPNRRPRARQ